MKNKKKVAETEKEEVVTPVEENAVEKPEEEVEVNYEEELAKQKDAYLRLYAEFDNYKKRSARERAEWLKMSTQDVMKILLPILDDMERGLAASHAQGKEEDVKGFEMIYQKLVGALAQKGLKAMEVAAGDEFDVDKHDAIARIPAPSEELKERIVDVTQKGYYLSDKVLRYAKVVMGE
ncbi:MAG: nucleotide exchange factor GrpE [Flavobacteriales bacterium]|nr:nucleotide exchange factor GrpE [Flavobacteriales bacterium]